jgi:hypothetical protein
MTTEQAKLNRQELKRLLLNQSCDRDPDGITAWYRIGKESTLDVIDRFTWEKICHALAEQRAEIKRDMIERMSQWHGNGKAMVEDYFASITEPKV